MNTLIIATIAMALAALAFAEEPSGADHAGRAPFQYSELDRCELGQPDRFSEPP